jgi:hypothetical protein
MLERLYELLMSFVTYILGFFGIEFSKKSVSFADEKGATKEETAKPTETSSGTEVAAAE